MHRTRHHKLQEILAGRGVDDRALGLTRNLPLACSVSKGRLRMKLQLRVLYALPLFVLQMAA